MAARNSNLNLGHIFCECVCNIIWHLWVALVCKVKMVWWKFKMRGDLNSVLTLPLCIFNIRVWEQFCRVDKPQNDHHDMFLQSMWIDQKVWFGKDLILMPKVGIRLIWSKVTITTCVDVFIFIFISDLSQWVIFWVY